MRRKDVAVSGTVGLAVALLGKLLLATGEGDAHGGLLHDLSHVALLGGAGAALAPLLARPPDARGYVLAVLVALGAWLVATALLSLAI